LEATRKSRQRLDCGRFSAAFEDAEAI